MTNSTHSDSATMSATTRCFSASNKNSQHKALSDLYAGLKKWRIWCLLANQDIKLRYRRSVLGPFWITLSMAITVYSMGFLYGHLFRIDPQTYLPFLTTGMLSWSLISTTLTDMTEAFITSYALIRQIKLPYSLYIHRIAWRNLIMFFHNLVVYIPILIIYHATVKLNVFSLLLLPNLLIIYFNTFCFGLILALLGTRYRDIAQIMRSLIQVVFFITPILWSPAILPNHYYFVFTYNPFYAFIELIRAPLMGTLPNLTVTYMIGIMTAIGALLAWWLFKKYRARIIYWL